jgi:hypothetical protein
LFTTAAEVLALKFNGVLAAIFREIVKLLCQPTIDKTLVK